METVEHWIDGTTTVGSSRDRGIVWNPATGKQTAEVALGTRDDADAAVASAARAFEQWSTSSLSTRTKVMFRFRELVAQHVDELARLITAEHGKVLSDAVGEITRGLEVVEFACGIPELLKGDVSIEVSTGVDVVTMREPLGVVVGITPFNFPVMVPMWMHPLAIACGNTFVLKPSERDPSASMLIADLYRQAGLPDGVFNVLHGDRHVVERLLEHPDVAAVSFVGSTPIAETIHRTATRYGKRVQALGGAKNHAVVLPDADLGFVAGHLTSAAYGSAGERCMAVSAVVAVGSSAERLVDALADRADQIRVGPGHQQDSEMGPVISAASRDRIVQLIGAGEQDGAHIRVDGRDQNVPGYEDGFFVGPTLLDHVTTDMSVYREEIFGPVLGVLRADDVDSAIEIVNGNPYGNGTALFTSSGGAARRFQREVNVGMIGINVPVPVPVAYHSFGGWKDSLFGQTHVHGREGVQFYTRSKVVTSRWPVVGDPVGAVSLDFPSLS